MHPLEGTPGATEIEIVGTGAPVYNVRVADGGKRLFIDLSNSDVEGVAAAITTPVGVVGGVLTQAFKTGAGSLTRLNVSLQKNATFRVKIEGNVVHVLLVPNAITTAAAVTAAPASTASAAPTVAVTQTTTSAEMKDVKFERAGAFDRVVVALSALPSYALVPAMGGKLRLEMKSTVVPAALARTLDVTAYKGALKSVSSFADDASGTAIVEIDRASDAQGTLSVEGTNLVWSFAAPKGVTVVTPTAKPTGPDGGAVRRTTTIAREPQGAVPPPIDTSIRGGDPSDPVVETVGGGGAAGFTSGVNGQAARYTGRRIEIDLKDADIHNVLRMLADVGHVNMVVAEDVSGSITIRMRNVPWDQALDVVLQAKGLGMVRTGNLIRVAPLATLQKERELQAARRKAEFEATPLETRLIPVNYANAEEVQARAKDFLSPRGSLAVDDRTNIIIARDIPANLNHIEELVRSLDFQTPQVLIEARIVEATSRYQRDVGIQWGGDATFSQATGNPTGVAFPSRASVAGGNYDNQTPTAGISPFQRQVTTPNFAVNLPAAVGTGQGGALGLSFGSIDNALNLGVRLSAAEASGLVRIVSSPRILTLDNREARINQGTLIPFAQVSALGVQTTFQEAKLQLLVRPHVTADGSISMHVKISRDEPDFNQTSARGDPTILKREAETDLLIMDGHTAVIGGIYTRNTGRNLDQVPFFGDIPILGILFQRRRASDTRNELVIFITPRIVNRAEALGH
jgi:type IV pilus assembly protein PilQ